MKLRGRLSTKFLTLGITLLLLALTSIGLTMWVTRQLDGGAAAINEAGRLRMQAWRLASAAQAGQHPDEVAALVREMDLSLALLRQGDAQRPLSVPWNQQTLLQFSSLQASWEQLRPLWNAVPVPDSRMLIAGVDRFVDQVSQLVLAVERNMAQLTAVLNLFQFLMMALAVAAAVLSMYVGYLFVIHPLKSLRQGLLSVEAGDLSARVTAEAHVEFRELAAGFNHMAQTLQSMYSGLERKVAEKTRDLQAERSRLAALYEVSNFLVQSHTLEKMVQGFAQKVRQLSNADAVAVRWSDDASQRYLMLGSDCLPQELVQEERCIEAGLCACGQLQATARTRVIPIILESDRLHGSCARAGYTSLVSIPIRLQKRVLGEIDLFYRHEASLTTDDRGLYDALAGHLANAVENLRIEALVREAAVSEERALLARELHDSIAQSLAFMKIQITLLRQALRHHPEQSAGVIDELEAGVRESTNDVRELLVHFRTRTNSDDIEQALRTTLRKFEHQSGLKTRLEIRGFGLALPSDVQLQVLHVVQEALSNVRKHAQASEVSVTVERDPNWRFLVRDNGQGFAPYQSAAESDTHVGMQIMRERAALIGAQVQVVSAPRQGTEVSIELVN